MTQRSVLFVHMQLFGRILVLTLELSEEAVEDVIAYPQRFAKGIRALERATNSRLSVAGDESKLVIVGYASLIEEGLTYEDIAGRFSAHASEQLGFIPRFATRNGLQLVAGMAA